MKYMKLCRGINWNCSASYKKCNEINLLIKYTKSFLWRVVERLFYIQDAWRLKVKHHTEVQKKTFKTEHLFPFRKMS